MHFIPYITILLAFKAQLTNATASSRLLLNVIHRIQTYTYLSVFCVLCSHWISHTYTHMHTVYEITARRAAKIYSTKYHPTYAYMHWPIAYAHICRIAHLNDIFHVFRFLAFNEISTDHNSHNAFVAKVITF